MKTKKHLTITALLASLSFITLNVEAQEKTSSILRLSILNPAIEYEQGILDKSIITTRLGWGLNHGYPNLESMQTGWVYMLVPYAHLEYKNLYNRNKRINEGKNVQSNSGNYWGVRCQYRDNATKTNIHRKDNKDFSIGPMWGYQGTKGKLHYLFDLGGVYYFDTLGNSGVMYSINLRLGLNLWEKR